MDKLSRGKSVETDGQPNKSHICEKIPIKLDKVKIWKAVCGESRTHGLEGGKIPRGIYLSLHKLLRIRWRGTD